MKEWNWKEPCRQAVIFLQWSQIIFVVFWSANVVPTNELTVPFRNVHDPDFTEANEMDNFNYREQ